MTAGADIVVLGDHLSHKATKMLNYSTAAEWGSFQRAFSTDMERQTFL